MSNITPRLIRFALLTFLSHHSVFAQSNAAPMHRAEQEVRRASLDEVKALLANDVKSLTRLWAEEFVVTNPLNQFVNKGQVLALIRSDTLAFQSYDRQIEYVRAYDAMVVVAGRETVVWAGKMPAAGKTSHLRFTALWMERGSRWQEVARHANIVDIPPIRSGSPSS
jgi:hypothetical protein